MRNKTHRPLIVACLALAAILALAACGLNVDLASKPTLYVDEFVRRPWNPNIYIQPENRPVRPLKVVLVPLHVRQTMANRIDVGRGLSKIMWQTWLAEKVFPSLSFDRDHHWTGPKDALARLAGSDVDLVIGGCITNLMFGGTVGDNTMSLELEIYHVGTGELIWSMAHAGQMAQHQTQDYIIVNKEARLPSDPMHAIMTVLARDLAEPIKLWHNGPDKKGGKDDPAPPEAL